MSSLFNQEEADAIVRAVQLLHGQRIIIVNKEDAMALIKGEDGKTYQVALGQEVTRDELLERVKQAANALHIAESDLAEFDQLNGAQHASTDNQEAAGPAQAVPEAPVEPSAIPTAPGYQPPSGTVEPSNIPSQPAPQAGTPEPAPVTNPPQVTMQ